MMHRRKQNDGYRQKCQISWRFLCITQSKRFMEEHTTIRRRIRQNSVRSEFW